MLIAFVLYAAIGIALELPSAAVLRSPWSIAFVLIWPVRLLLLPGVSLLLIYAALALAASVVLLALVERQPFAWPLTVGLWPSRRPLLRRSSGALRGRGATGGCAPGR